MHTPTPFIPLIIKKQHANAPEAFCKHRHFCLSSAHISNHLSGGTRAKSHLTKRNLQKIVVSKTNTIFAHGSLLIYYLQQTKLDPNYLLGLASHE